MDERDYFHILRKSVDLRGKRVLEIGGSIPAELTESANVAQWISIDVDEKLVGSRVTPGRGRSLALLMDASSMGFAGSSFDVVFSGNAFEHILLFPEALAHVFRVLKPGGLFFTIFSPIWSGPDGHHTWIHNVGSDGVDRPLVFSDHLFPDWEHLACTPDELKENLTIRYGGDLSRRMVDFIYRSNFLSRNIDTLYETEIGKYDYEKIVSLRLRSRHGPRPDILKRLTTRYPEVRDFRTKGYLWFLAKRPISKKVWVRGTIGCGYAIVGRKLKERTKR